MTTKLKLLLAVCAIFLGGCASAPQLAVPLTPSKLPSAASKIGVVMTAMPKTDTSFPGADCLLCMAAASVANSSLTTYTQTLGNEDLLKLKGDVAELLRKKGAQVTVIDAPFEYGALPKFANETPNFARKDHTQLREKLKVDKLVVIQFMQVGVRRTYAAYFPTSEPKGTVSGVAYMVNLADNAFDWYAPFDISKSADGKWDEPPKFPGITNSYFQAIELARDEILKPFN